MIDNCNVIKAAGNEDIQLNFKGYAGEVFEKDSYFAGNPSNGIALANWNHIDESVAENLSRMGVCLESKEEFEVCCECGKVVRMFRPASIDLKESWVKNAAEVGVESGEIEVFCGDCVNNKEEFLEELIGEVLSDPTRCVTIQNIDHSLQEAGFDRILSNLERGMGEGQNADPKIISDSLKKVGLEQFLFVMETASPTMISFGVYVWREDINLKSVDMSQISTNGASVREVMDQAVGKLATKLGDIGIVSSSEAEEGEYSGIMAAHAALDGGECKEPLVMTHEETCLITRLPDMGGKYLQEIKKMVNVEEEFRDYNSAYDITDPEEIWESASFRKVVFKNVGTNREGEINRARERAKQDFYSSRNIRHFYRRVLPSMLS